MADTGFPGKLALQQRVLTAYRAPFFSALAQACEGGLSVCAGLPRPEESIVLQIKSNLRISQPSKTSTCSKALSISVTNVVYPNGSKRAARMLLSWKPIRVTWRRRLPCIG